MARAQGWQSQAKRAASKGGKKEKKNVPHGVAHIQATFNNTIITISDPKGNVICWVERRRPGLQGLAQGHALRRADGGAATPATRRGTTACARVDVRVKGPGSGRESSIRALQAAGIEVKSIKDVTPIPHNGCRPPKRRRV